MTTIRLSLVLGLAACVTPQPVADDPAQLVRDDGEAAPVIEKVQYAAIDDTQTAILITIAEGSSPDSLTWSFAGEDVTLYDNGSEGDAKEGDLVYTGVASGNLDAFHEAREAYGNALADQDRLVASRFAGHRVAAIAELESDFVDQLPTEEVTLDDLGGTFEAVLVFPLVSAEDGAAASAPSAHDPYRTLVITEPDLVHHTDFTGSWQIDSSGKCSQVGDPNGPAGFRYLMGEIANGAYSADEFISEWLAAQTVSRTVNGYSVDLAVQGVYDLHNGSAWYTTPIPWPKLYDDGSASTYNDILDGYYTPVQLMAIVNRFDLAAGGYDGRAEAELRFVFTFLDEESCKPVNGNVILEYAVPLDDCAEIEHWAQIWQQLDGMDPASDEYRDLLVSDIIEPVVVAGANPDRPNESNLKVLRTNEQVFIWPHYVTSFPTSSARDWRLEEWAVDTNTNLLANQTLAQTPGPDWVDPDFSGSSPYPQDIDGYIDANQSDILAGTHSVDATYSGSNFAGPQVRYGDFSQASGPYTVPSGQHVWRAMSWGSANVSSVEARQLFSLSTCSGCHAGEVFEDADGTGAFNDSNWASSVPGGQLEEPFRHVRPDGTLTNPAHLSRFLTGTNSTCTPGNEFVSPLGTMSSCSVDTCCPIGDPVFGYEDGQVHYNEFARRGAILQDVLLNGCSALKTQNSSAIVASAH